MQTPPPGVRLERLRLSLLGIIGSLTMAWPCAALSIGPEPQDACRIGAVSPEAYHTIAAQVAAMPPLDWETAIQAERHADRVAAALRERLEQILAGPATADEQVAAVHALMRSIGAGFGWADRGSRDGVTVVFYKYHLDVNQIGLRRLISRWAQIIIVLEIPPGPGRAVLTRVVALMPEMFEPGRPGWKKPPQERPCPPVPAEAEPPLHSQEPAGDAAPSSEQPQGDEAPEGALTPLDDDALSRALYGNYVRRLDLEGVYDVNDTQYFCSDGKYGEFGGGRASVSGLFSISNGTVRVVYPRGRISYRRFYIDARGSYYYVEEGSEGETDRSSPIPVSILPKTKGCS
jgi:hypothetical protein